MKREKLSVYSGFIYTMVFLAVLIVPYGLGWALCHISHDVLSHLILYSLGGAGLGVFLMLLGIVLMITDSLWRFLKNAQKIFLREKS
ncbi:hypothetical protein ABRZ24_11360 [Brenneria populi]|uniref:Uncharacterized protein n=1 Tax=Brenneria populi TaxID=1505588 RepID=A0ABU6JSA7_9GAMM|nr:hypothetical protein [Brenneria populi Li et al. 2015]